MSNPITLDLRAILNCLPHRYPFLLIDKVIELIPQQSITAIKNVTFNEPFFPGHFPDQPIMPGVLILEAMAQATALLGLHSLPMSPSGQKLIYLLAGIDKAQFKKPVVPGDQLKIHATVQKAGRRSLICQVEAMVESTLVCTAEITGVSTIPV